jgi:hypothetical protein
VRPQGEESKYCHSDCDTIVILNPVAALRSKARGEESRFFAAPSALLRMTVVSGPKINQEEKDVSVCR